jgi:hypothetical protein
MIYHDGLANPTRSHQDNGPFDGDIFNKRVKQIEIQTPLHTGVVFVYFACGPPGVFLPETFEYLFIGERQ